MKKTGIIIALLVAASASIVRAHSQEAPAKKAAPIVPKSSQPEEKAASQAAKAQAAKAQAAKEAQDSFVLLMSAIETDDLGAFVARGETAFAMAITQPMFSKLNAQLAPRLKRGYQSTFLCPMKQRGYDVFLWKLSFKDGGDDLLASLSMKNGKVSGFFLN